MSSPEQPAPSSSTRPNAPRQPPLDLNFPHGAPPDIIRANQKDVYYQSVLHEQMSTVFQQFFGSLRQHQWQKEISTFSDFSYYALTTLLGIQTLGEEYCDLAQVSISSQTYPGILRRACLVFAHTLLPYIYHRGVTEIKRRARTTPRNVPAKSWKERATTFVNKWLPTAQQWFKNITPLHLAIFYFVGAYYTFSKRITGIRYIFTRKLGPHEQRAGYEVLGVLIVAQLLIQGGMAISKRIAEIREQRKVAAKVAVEQQMAAETKLVAEQDDFDFMDEFDASADSPAEEKELSYEEMQMLKCALCLEPRKVTTATPCGHLFCWDCVIEWCQNKPECPLCRSSVNVSHLIPLNNF